MAEPALVVLDTSYFVAGEQGRPLGPLPAASETAVSVVTLAELHLGVLLASSGDDRLTRLRTLLRAQLYEILPADAAAAERYAGIVIQAKERGLRIKANDAWIAAIAAANGAAVATQDDDFDDLPVEIVRL